MITQRICRRRGPVIVSRDNDGQTGRGRYVVAIKMDSSGLTAPHHLQQPANVGGIFGAVGVSRGLVIALMVGTIGKRAVIRRPAH